MIIFDQSSQTICWTPVGSAVGVSCLQSSNLAYGSNSFLSASRISLNVLKSLPDWSIDSIVTDPPYELTGARPGGRSEATRGKVRREFMGLAWDATGIAKSMDLWAEALRC
jgi:DNA modification methylase